MKITPVGLYHALGKVLVFSKKAVMLMMCLGFYWAILSLVTHWGDVFREWAIESLHSYPVTGCLWQCQVG
jgi:hypothetical protein